VFLHIDVYVEEHFWKIIFFALHVFLYVRVLRTVCVRTRAQLRGNITYGRWAHGAIDGLIDDWYNASEYMYIHVYMTEI